METPLDELLFNCIGHGYLDVPQVVKIIHNGANVCAKDKRGYTMLHAAAAYNRHECMKILLEHANITLNKTDMIKFVNTPVCGDITPLLCALGTPANSHGSECFRLLLEYGADPNFIITLKNPHREMSIFDATCTFPKEYIDAMLEHCRKNHIIVRCTEYTEQLMSAYNISKKGLIFQYNG